MRWLLRSDTRTIRAHLLRTRLRSLAAGDDPAPVAVAFLFTGYAVMLSLPGTTTAKAPSWQVVHDYFGADLGLGIACALLAVGTWLAVLDLVGLPVQGFVWLTAAAFLIALGITWVLSNPLSLGSVIATIFAVLSLWAYLRTDRD